MTGCLWLQAVLADPAAFRAEWVEEYELVCAGVAQLADGELTTVREVGELGLIMVETTQPTHYYALFGLTAGYDTVVSQYSDGRCNISHKQATVACDRGHILNVTI